MADYAIHDTTLYDIADVIRKKDGSSALIDPADFAGRINLMGMLEEKTVSGSVVTFSDGADDVPLKSCEVTIAPTLDGVSSVDVVQTKKNFVDDNLSNLEQGTIEGDHGTNSASNTRVRNANYTPFPYDEIYPNYKLTIPNGWKFAIRFYKFDNTYVTLPSWAVGFVTNLPSDLVGQGVTKARFVFAKTDNSAITPEDVKNVGFQIEVGSTATAYTPYVQPTTHTASLGRVIYGGTPDVVNGTGTETAGKAVLDPTETWLYSSSWSKTNTNVFYTQATHDEISFATWSDNSILLCNTLPVGTRNEINSADTNMIGVSGNVGHPCITVRIDKTTCPDLASFIQYITNNQIPFVYKKATPEDFTFTPVPIITRLGDNTLWGDGDLSVTYRSSGTQTLIPPTLISKTITANGTYSAEDDGADGYDEVTVNVSGGGGNTPQATQTLICDNSSLGSTLTFTDNYENYDLIKFVVYRSDVQNTFVFYATPDMINACWQYSSNRINFNQPYGNNFVCYTKTSNTSWSRYGVRNLAVQYVYGLTFTNCTVTETELYNRQGIGSSAVTFTPPTGESFLNYDYILFMTCTGNSDETQVNLEVFQPNIEKDIFGSNNVKEDTVTVYRYNTGGTTATVTENTITSYQYFYASGLKLNFNQQNLLGGSLNSSNNEQEESENESD